MRSPARSSCASAALAAALMALITGMGTDYPADAGPAISALARGDIHGFTSAQVQMGPLSILLRAPLAALAGPDLIWAYRLGALARMLALVGLGVLVARRAGAGVGLLAGALLVANPVTLDALHLGHPEELLGAALCVAAVLLAAERPLWAAAALGAALATKQWALIAIAPVLIAAPREARVRLAATAAGIAAAVIVPVALADPHAFVSALDHPAFGLSAMRTGNLWGFTAISERVSLRAVHCGHDRLERCRDDGGVEPHAPEHALTDSALDVRRRPCVAPGRQGVLLVVEHAHIDAHAGERVGRGATTGKRAGDCFSSVKP